MCLPVSLVSFRHGREADVNRIRVYLLHYPRKIKFIHSFILSVCLSVSLLMILFQLLSETVTGLQTQLNNLHKQQLSSSLK